MDENGKPPIATRISIILIGIASAAMVVTIYHCIAVGWCNRRRQLHGPQRSQVFRSEIAEIHSSINNSTVQLIPTHKYQKDMELVGEDGTCPVCLSEFEEGEDLRTLPECLHSFHVVCIDMWLFSHPSCPMCRADATPSPQIFCAVTDPSFGAIEMHQEPSMLQGDVVHARPL